MITGTIESSPVLIISIITQTFARLSKLLSFFVCSVHIVKKTLQIQHKHSLQKVLQKCSWCLCFYVWTYVDSQLNNRQPSSSKDTTWFKSYNVSRHLSQLSRRNVSCGMLHLQSFLFRGLSLYCPLFQFREERFRATSESTNQRVLWWALAQTLILLCTGFWQMRHLKGFFEAKKLV